MTIEDRLGRGFDAQHAETLERVAESDRATVFEPRGRSAVGPVLSVISVLFVCALGFLAVRNAGPTLVDTDIGPADGIVESIPTTIPHAPHTTLAVPPSVITTGTQQPTTTLESEEAVSEPSTEPTTGSAPTVPTTSTGEPRTDQTGGGPATTVPDQAPPSPTSSPTSAPATSAPVTSTPSTSTPSPAAPPYVAIANSECASGLRAPLENATLRYLGLNEGWGRLDDLVDEQDGPFYFEAWEPGYPLDVSVEVTLAETVRATEILVAQDPFTPVSGDIDIESAIGSGPIALSGTEGWRGLTLPNDQDLSSFTIRRDGPLENIMEVLVCVLPPTP